MAVGTSGAVAVLEKYKSRILEDWIEGQLRDPRIRGELFKQPDALQRQCQDFIDALVRAAVAEGLDYDDSPQYQEVKSVLADVAEERRQQGFDAQETAAAIISFKDHWIPLLQTEFQDDPGALSAELIAVAKLIDSLALAMFEQTLRETEDRARLLVENVKDYALVTLDSGGHVISWNAGAQRITGYRADEILGRHFSCFYSADDVQQGKTERELNTASTDGRFEDEGWRTRKDGSRFWANTIITALRDRKSKLQGFALVSRDISERKRAEEQIKRQAREIQELSTPVMQVWQGIVAAPLIGSLDSQRTQQFMERLLQRIVETNSPVALVDITGVPTIDTQTAQHIIETISAVRLLGAQVILTGVRPTTAQTLVHLGIDLSNIITRSSLAGGLRVALEALDLEVLSKNGSRQGDTT